MIYAFTGDLNPQIEKQAEQAGFRKAFAVFKRPQIAEILHEIQKRDMELEQVFQFQNEAHSMSSSFQPSHHFDSNVQFHL